MADVMWPGEENTGNESLLKSWTQVKQTSSTKHCVYTWSTDVFVTLTTDLRQESTEPFFRVGMKKDSASFLLDR